MTFSLSGMMMTSGDFTLTGFSSDTAIANAANGTFTMSSGEVFGYGESDNGKAIISKALADFNGLKVGDEITVTNPSDTSTTYTFTIGGIYKNSTSSNTSAMGPMGGTSQDADNAIYTSVSTLKSLGLDADTTANDDDNNTTTQLSYTYVLGSADDYETFASDVRKAGLDGHLHRVVRRRGEPRIEPRAARQPRQVRPHAAHRRTGGRCGRAQSVQHLRTQIRGRRTHRHRREEGQGGGAVRNRAADRDDVRYRAWRGRRGRGVGASVEPAGSPRRRPRPPARRSSSVAAPTWAVLRAAALIWAAPVRLVRAATPAARRHRAGAELWSVDCPRRRADR